MRNKIDWSLVGYLIALLMWAFVIFCNFAFWIGIVVCVWKLADKI